MVTLMLAFGSMRGTVTGITDTTTSATAGLMLLMALPTMVLFVVLELNPTIAAVAGAMTALPLWFYFGTRLAAHSWTWRDWWRRYVMVSIGWAVLAIVLLAVVASLSG
jgi:hypothetical protein